MGLYADGIFPLVMDWLLGKEAFARLRTGLLAPVSGKVLEIGFGTGLNLPCYGQGVTDLHVIDPARLLPERVSQRIAAVAFPVHVVRLDAETLPFDERQFDNVVSTWTLCTIGDPVRALREVRRVLKPAGRFHFLEHGRSADRGVAAWQDRLNPIQQVIGCGCNLNRPIDRFLTQAGLVIGNLDRFQMDGVPRIVGEMYRGWAGPSGSASVQ